jgi:alpha-tubulin suppressor-like RCC1 family protein
LVVGFYNVDIIKVAAGQFHSVMLNKDGQLFSFGEGAVRSFFNEI